MSIHSKVSREKGNNKGALGFYENCITTTTSQGDVEVGGD